MPLKLCVGVSRKVGLPAYGSAGASCSLELELPHDSLERDLEGFHARVRGAYVAACRTVQDERARAHAGPPGDAPARADDRGSTPDAPERNGRRGSGPRGNGARATAPRAATPKQIAALVALARRAGADLEGPLRDECDAARPEELTVRQASRVIALLKATADA